MTSSELKLPVLTPPPGGLQRLQHALHAPPRSRSMRPAWALAATACAVLLVAPAAYRALQEHAFQQRLEAAIDKAARSAPIRAEGFVLSSDRRLDNGTRVIELQRTRARAAGRT
jgi:hypothetical protein